MIKNSLPFVYEEADEIIISIDKKRQTWAGAAYDFDEQIVDWVRAFDKDKKIRIYEDDFYLPANTAMENETRQRQISASQFSETGWVVQLDVDEYFLNFKAFAEFLKSKTSYFISPTGTSVDIAVHWFNLFKKNSRGYFVVSKPLQPIRIATNHPQYVKARSTHAKTIYTPFIIVHDTWARSEEEILLKINNWGHKDDFDTQSFYLKWKNLSEGNCHNYKNFNPVKPYSALGKLHFIEAGSLKELLNKIKIKPPSAARLKLKNIKQKIWH